MYLLLFALGIILWIEYSFTKPTFQESIVNQTVPISFPGQGQINLPPIVQPQNGPLQVEGPVRLGIAGNRYMDFSTSNNRASIGFMNNGLQGQIVSRGGSGQNDGNLAFNARKINIPSPVSITGRLDAPKVQLNSLKVARTDSDPYPSWTPGIHTLDLYANGTVGAGQNGGVNAYIHSSGVIWSSNVAYLNTIRANQIIVGGRNLVGELNQLTSDLNNIRIRN
jgi:hypothetical protein